MLGLKANRNECRNQKKALSLLAFEPASPYYETGAAHETRNFETFHICLLLIEKINVYLGTFLKWIFCIYETTTHNSNDGFLSAVLTGSESSD